MLSIVIGTTLAIIFLTLFGCMGQAAIEDAQNKSRVITAKDILKMKEIKIVH